MALLGLADRDLSYRGILGSFRLRILFWSLVAGLLFGAIEFGRPLEDALRVGRNKLHKREASGQIIIAAIDDRSLREVQKWPWSRANLARVAGRLDALGAERIFFDFDFSAKGDPRDDKQLEQTLKGLRRKATAATFFAVDPSSGKRTYAFPRPNFLEHIELANINFPYDWRGSVWRIPYAMRQGDRSYPSFAAELAGVEGEAGETFLVDYSIDARSVPSISAVDILNGKVRAASIEGKKVIIAPTSLLTGDLHFLPGVGPMPGVYFHALGGETLRAGRPVDIGWFATLLLAAVLASGCLFARRLRVSVAVLISGILVLISAPLALELRGINADVVPALFLLVVSGGTFAWFRFRHLYRMRGSINAISGLPNLNALREVRSERHLSLVAARVQNYAQIATALAVEDESKLVHQIANRLSLGTSITKIYHGDEGIFAWLSDDVDAAAIGEQLEALHAFFRNPVMVAGNPVDLSITFGIDAGSDRTLSNRLASSLVAANEAVSEGVRWKAYDPAKLKDSAWKLSLLSQLDSAIDAGDVWVAYQPKLDLRRQLICGAEALVRWTHPTKGPIEPIDFILAAEQNDRIQRLTTFVLDNAIRAGTEINARGISFDIAVNLSARLIDDAGLEKLVLALLAKHGLDPHRLTLEVTETAAISSSGMDMSVLQRLRDAGVKISIDDYGMGLSTLDYLKKIPATEIKIDKSFVQAITKSQSDKLMVHSTIQLAHSLGQKVVAEGVEDWRTLEALTAMGCDIGQGYFIDRPMDFTSLRAQLFRKARRDAAAYR